MTLGAGARGDVYKRQDRSTEGGAAGGWTLRQHPARPAVRYQPRQGTLSARPCLLYTSLGASDNPNGKGWAVPGKGYGSKIIALLGQIMAFEVPQTSAPSEPEEQEPEFPAYQLEGLETLTEAGVINSPEFWRQKFSEQVTVGEMFGILGLSLIHIWACVPAGLL